MKIIVRLPNWLGDLVMSSGFMHHLHQVYPQAQIDVVCKKGIHALVPYFEMVSQCHVFDKAEWPGLSGARRFAKALLRPENYDLAICLPESFSSAYMLWHSGAPKRIGFRKELRSWMLTQSYNKPQHQHRVQDYLFLLEKFSGKPCPHPVVTLLNRHAGQRRRQVVVNINSEADSRRLPVEKAAEVLNELSEACDAPILLIGAPKELPHVSAALALVRQPQRFENLAGKTSMVELVELFSATPVMLTTDSGPMHLANSLGVHTVALEGASDERNTAPFNAEKSTLLRFGQLPCEPCVRNTCQFGVPKCLLGIQNQRIVTAITSALKNAGCA